MCFCCKKNIEESSTTEEDLENPKIIEKEEKLKDVPFTKILAFEPNEAPKMIIASVFSLIVGGLFPAWTVLFGEFLALFATKFGEERLVYINYYVLGFLGLAVIALFCHYIANVLWVLSAENTAGKIRDKYFRALLQQEISYYDQKSSSSMSLDADIEIIKGAHEKMNLFVSAIGQISLGIAFAFWRGWKLTLVMLAVVPLIAVSNAIFSKLITGKTIKGTKLGSKVSEVASESLSGIKTVYSFVGESLISEKHGQLLEKTVDNNVCKSHFQALQIGMTSLLIFSMYSMGFYFGGRLIEAHEIPLGSLLSVFFSIIIGTMGFSTLGIVATEISKAQGAAAGIFALFNRVPEINTEEDVGVTLPNIYGKLSFQDIDFTYPTRPDTPVLRKFNLDISAGKTIALVGPSGSGKSTIVQLLERFYDPLDGTLLVDDVNIKDLNLKWYRRNVGLVAQEPILFSGTIKENILFGNPLANMEEIEEAAKLANAYEFIMQQPDGFDTLLGEKGTQLSGGQKQRVAIARAILKNPKILLLDEATSALDTESESLVQDALDKLMKGRTTIIIAHRLSTVRNADAIVVMKKGKVVEIGTHDELMDLNGLYTNLVNKQMVSAEKKMKNSLKKSSKQPLKKSEL
jgi:ATP-binding cassette subfamily B (MDR/TAP) protein 1